MRKPRLVVATLLGAIGWALGLIIGGVLFALGDT
jgi:hypothetical protein